MTEALYALFRRSFPFVRREEETARDILSNPENRIFIHKDDSENLIGAAVVHKNTILLLCVDAPIRNQGIGYRFANQTDLPSILECTFASEEGFSKYYEESESYEPDSTDKVLIALDGDKVVGTLMEEDAPFMTKRVYIP